VILGGGNVTSRGVTKSNSRWSPGQHQFAGTVPFPWLLDPFEKASDPIWLVRFRAAAPRPRPVPCWIFVLFGT